MRRWRGVAVLGLITVCACGTESPGAPQDDEPPDPPDLSELPSFPGAEGFGATTPGGRGGRVLIVSSLEDSGPGTLREALEETSGPRIVVFEVAGVIRLERPLLLEGEEGSFVTLAGQSAPGGGVTLANFPLSLRDGVHDVVVRHLRLRNLIVDGSKGSIGDGVELRGASRVVLDHLSVAWASDEGISIEVGGNHDITVQNTLVAETLLNGDHPSGGPHSRCMIVSDGSFNVTMHRNFLVSCNRRNPALNGSSELGGSDFPLSDFRYNLIYNWGRTGGQFARGARANLVANVYRFGPDTGSETPLEANDREAEDTEVFLGENCTIRRNGMTGPDILNCPGDQSELVTRTFGEFVTFADAPFEVPPVTAPEEVVTHVLDLAGALPRDEADLRFVSQYGSYTGELGAGDKTHDDITVPEPEPGSPLPDRDRDGMPDDWERDHGLDPDDPADASSDPDGDGYTAIEAYLNERAAALEAGP